MRRFEEVKHLGVIHDLATLERISLRHFSIASAPVVRSIVRIDWRIPLALTESGTSVPAYRLASGKWRTGSLEIRLRRVCMAPVCTSVRSAYACAGPPECMVKDFLLRSPLALHETEASPISAPALGGPSWM